MAQIIQRIVLIIMAGHLCLATNAPRAETLSICLSSCVSLNQPAQRIVALNWSAAEMLLTLGIEPIAIAETKSYKKWQTNHPALPKNVIDIGRRQEPHLASIAKLKPDLIIGYNFRHQRISPKLNGIAPTLLYQQFPNSKQADFRYFDQAIKVFMAIAKATGKEHLGQRIVAQMHRELLRLKSSIKQKPQRIVYAKLIGMGYGLRVFSDKSLPGDILTRLGLNYAWTDSLPNKDFTHLQIEQLPRLSDSFLLLAGNQSNNDRMTSSRVWQAMASVKQHRVRSVTPLWSFGGPVSITKMAQAFTKALNTESVNQ